MSYPYWQAFKRRMRQHDWCAIAAAVAAVIALSVVVMVWGGDQPPAQEMLP